MFKSRPTEWTFITHGFPGDVMSYYYVLGDDIWGGDGSLGLEEGASRSVTLPNSDIVVEDTVERWLFAAPLPYDTVGQATDVTFRVSVPSTTPRDTEVRLRIDNADLSGPVVMQRMNGNPWALEVTVRLVGPGNYAYWFEADGMGIGPQMAVDVAFADQKVNDWVVAWSSSPLAGGGDRSEYIAGFYTPDFLSPPFLELSPTTFASIERHNGSLVAISSVWNYGSINPLPVVESRGVLSASPPSREDLMAQASMAREAGLDVFMALQFNLEMSTGGIDALNGQKSAEWWDAWLGEAEKLCLWHAVLAEEMGAELIMLPGYVIHVFAQHDAYPSDEYFQEFDQRITELIGKARDIYSGKLLVSGGIREFTFQSQVDFLGVTTFDTGMPDLPPTASADEWREAYETLFIEKVDPIYERWGKPVFFYTIDPPRRVLDANDSTNEE
ncbi:MAG: hypothetical protein O2812_01110, partial [Chloroflexi bacterium]|nr:hypothetical protein [Chloroflexota bacterium]